MLTRTLSQCARIFKEDHDERYKDQWCAWYDATNWDRWRHLRDRDSRNPQSILWGGMDIRLNIHDAGGISLPNDPDLVKWAARQWKMVAETPIQVTLTETMIIPVDFKVGPTMSNDDLHELKV